MSTLHGDPQDPLRLGPLRPTLAFILKNVSEPYAIHWRSFHTICNHEKRIITICLEDDLHTTTIMK